MLLVMEHSGGVLELCWLGRVPSGSDGRREGGIGVVEEVTTSSRGVSGRRQRKVWRRVGTERLAAAATTTTTTTAAIATCGVHFSFTNLFLV